MIRMGRGSKDENASADETTDFQEQPSTRNFSYAAESPSGTQRAVSESEAMARDIKEGRLSGFVGAGTVLTGETNFQSMLRVDGHLTGTVTSDDGTLIVGSDGRVDANIDVAAAMVSGTINGDVVTSEKLELGRTARVTGNIQTPRLLMEDGAILEGNCSMIESKENLEQKVAEQKQQISNNESTSYKSAGSSTIYDETEDAELYDDTSDTVDEIEGEDSEEAVDAAAS